NANQAGDCQLDCGGESWRRAREKEDLGARRPRVASLGRGVQKAAAFSDSAVNEKAIRNTYTVTVNDVIVSTDLAVARDTWEETLYNARFSTTAHRTIQSFEVWQPQPDGQWKI